MRYITTALMFLLLPVLAIGQFTVTSTSPTDGATGVATNAILSITFSAPADTTRGLTFNGEIISNVDSVTRPYWSTDSRTVYFPAVLQPNTVYFMVIYAAYPAGGGTLQVPSGAHWTTGSSFPSNLYNVSGSISSGTTGVSPANAIVGLSSNGLGNNHGPAFVAGTVCDGSGNFVIPYVPIGRWDPIGAKDANGDGQIDPSKGDVIAVGDSVVVTNANIGGVSLVFQTFPPVPYTDARDTALATAALVLPANRELRRVYSYDVDSTGKASEWEFIYMVPGSSTITEIRIDQFGKYIEINPPDWNGAQYANAIPDILLAATADVFIANVEQAGGNTFRHQMPGTPGLFFRGMVTAGDLNYTQFFNMITDPTKFYWGAEYSYQIQATRDSSYPVAWKRFVGDFTTGTILSITGVNDHPQPRVPTEFSMGQNYPNPFNPSTTISFGLPVRSRVTLEVYNLIGQRVGTILDEERSAGTHAVSWEGVLPSGVYFYRIAAVGVDNPAQKFFQVRKMVLLK
jgi:hypothetical protein